MADPGWDKEASPYHDGERELHSRLGIVERQEAIGRRILRSYLPDQHQEFFEQLPFIVVGSVDQDGWPWASMLFGEPGFITSANENNLHINTNTLAGDPLVNNIAVGAPLGFLGIELPTRRRNRVNGIIASASSEGFDIDVAQTFGNCPQYIQTRSMEFLRDPRQHREDESEPLPTLDDAARQLIRGADTFFVTSYNDRDDPRASGGVDVSHRGGRPGFVHVKKDALTVPDFVGNFAFNTFGNFLINPKAGLLFIDFDSGDLLFLTGSVELIWETTPEIEAFQGAERAWTFQLEHGIRLRHASPLRFNYEETSPNTRLTGDWQQAARSLAATKRRDAWLPYRVARIENETASIRSFYLEAADDTALFTYAPGQYLTVRTTPQLGEAPLIRTYTLSSAPTDGQYRISVKRESNGQVSSHLHDTLEVGDVIEARAPRGDFVFDPSQERPALLLAAGVGITPMISMARAAATDLLRFRHIRSITVVCAARTTAEQAFADEFRDLAKATGGAINYVSIVSRPDPGEIAGEHFDFSGRLQTDVLQSVLSLDEYDVFLCGPAGFMQSAYNSVRSLGIEDKRIFAEGFGPASLQRTRDSGTNVEVAEEVAEYAVVSFADAAFEQPWTPVEGTLLKFAEQHGLNPAFGCRNGACGTCAVKLLDGAVTYLNRPAAAPADDEVLICCAVPASGSNSVELAM